MREQQEAQSQLVLPCDVKKRTEVSGSRAVPSKPGDSVFRLASEGDGNPAPLHGNPLPWSEALSTFGNLTMSVLGFALLPLLVPLNP